METVNLTLIDRQIMNSYVELIKGLESYLGSAYEIVLHSLENYEHSVVYIVNGEHTGRKIGAPITNKALEMLENFKTEKVSHMTYFTRNAKGEPLKSTTIAVNGENGRIIGLLCMNFYMNTSFYDVMSSFIPNMDEIKSDSAQSNSETFSTNVNDMIISLLNSVKAQVYSDQSISASNKNKAIVNILYDKGIFKIKDSVNVVADDLGISRNTVYMHLRNCTGKENEEY